MRNLVRRRKPGGGLSPVVSDQIWLLALLAAGSFVLAMVTVFVVSMFTEIRISAWGIVGSIAPWYVAIMAGWIVYIQIPLFVANGRTRKSGFRDWLNAGLFMISMGAILMAIGFVLEHFIYDLAGFTTDSESDRFFSGGQDVHVTIYQYLLIFAVWFALGGFVGGSLYRSPDMGWVSIPISIGVASLAGVWDHTGGGFFGFARRIIPGIDYQSHWLDFGLSALAVAGGIALAWRLVSDMALRNP